MFLGDEVTLVKEREPLSTFVTGQVSGVVVDKHNNLERVYIHGLDSAFWMHDSWKFVEHDEENNDEI